LSGSPKERKDDIFARFGNRCAYGETEIRGVDQPGDVEHYRPKLGVEGLDRKPIFVTRGGQKREHPGYCWLAYDWCNLLPACRLCNSETTNAEGKLVGKGNVFPVERGRNALDEASLVREKPLLLNPNQDEPSEHLELEGPTGVLIPRERGDGEPSERGQVTIDLLDLNRDGLVAQRKQAFHSFGKDLETLYRNLRKHSALGTYEMEQLKKFQAQKLPYMFARRLALQTLATRPHS
jgi:hypothetical protein